MEEPGTRHRVHRPRTLINSTSLQSIAPDDAVGNSRGRFDYLPPLRVRGNAFSLPTGQSSDQSQHHSSSSTGDSAGWEKEVSSDSEQSVSEGYWDKIALLKHRVSKFRGHDGSSAAPETKRPDKTTDSGAESKDTHTSRAARQSSRSAGRRGVGYGGTGGGSDMSEPPHQPNALPRESTFHARNDNYQPPIKNSVYERMRRKYFGGVSEGKVQWSKAVLRRYLPPYVSSPGIHLPAYAGSDFKTPSAVGISAESKTPAHRLFSAAGTNMGDSATGQAIHPHTGVTTNSHSAPQTHSGRGTPSISTGRLSTGTPSPRHTVIQPYDEDGFDVPVKPLDNKATSADGMHSHNAWGDGAPGKSTELAIYRRVMKSLPSIAPLPPALIASAQHVDIPDTQSQTDGRLTEESDGFVERVLAGACLAAGMDHTKTDSANSTAASNNQTTPNNQTAPNKQTPTSAAQHIHDTPDDDRFLSMLTAGSAAFRLAKEERSRERRAAKRRASKRPSRLCDVERRHVCCGKVQVGRCACQTQQNSAGCRARRACGPCNGGMCGGNGVSCVHIGGRRCGGVHGIMPHTHCIHASSHRTQHHSLVQKQVCSSVVQCACTHTHHGSANNMQEKHPHDSCSRRESLGGDAECKTRTEKQRDPQMNTGRTTVESHESSHGSLSVSQEDKESQMVATAAHADEESQHATRSEQTNEEQFITQSNKLHDTSDNRTSTNNDATRSSEGEGHSSPAELTREQEDQQDRTNFLRIIGELYHTPPSPVQRDVSQDQQCDDDGTVVIDSSDDEAPSVGGSTSSHQHSEMDHQLAVQSLMQGAGSSPHNSSTIVIVSSDDEDGREHLASTHSDQHPSNIPLFDDVATRASDNPEDEQSSDGSRETTSSSSENHDTTERSSDDTTPASGGDDECGSCDSDCSCDCTHNSDSSVNQHSSDDSDSETSSGCDCDCDCVSDEGEDDGESSGDHCLPGVPGMYPPYLPIIPPQLVMIPPGNLTHAMNHISGSYGVWSSIKESSESNSCDCGPDANTQCASSCVSEQHACSKHTQDPNVSPQKTRSEAKTAHTAAHAATRPLPECVSSGSCVQHVHVYEGAIMNVHPCTEGCTRLSGNAQKSKVCHEQQNDAGSSETGDANAQVGVVDDVDSTKKAMTVVQHNDITDRSLRNGSEEAKSHSTTEDKSVSEAARGAVAYVMDPSDTYSDETDMDQVENASSSSSSTEEDAINVSSTAQNALSNDTVNQSTLNDADKKASNTHCNDGMENVSEGKNSNNARYQAQEVEESKGNTTAEPVGTLSNEANSDTQQHLTAQTVSGSGVPSVTVRVENNSNDSGSGSWQNAIVPFTTVMMQMQATHRWQMVALMRQLLDHSRTSGAQPHTGPAAVLSGARRTSSENPPSASSQEETEPHSASSCEHTEHGNSAIVSRLCAALENVHSMYSQAILSGAGSNNPSASLNSQANPSESSSHRPWDSQGKRTHSQKSSEESDTTASTRMQTVHTLPTRTRTLISGRNRIGRYARPSRVPVLRGVEQHSTDALPPSPQQYTGRSSAGTTNDIAENGSPTGDGGVRINVDGSGANALAVDSPLFESTQGPPLSHRSLPRSASSLPAERRPPSLQTADQSAAANNTKKGVLWVAETPRNPAELVVPTMYDISPPLPPDYQLNSARLTHTNREQLGSARTHIDGPSLPSQQHNQRIGASSARIPSTSTDPSSRSASRSGAEPWALADGRTRGASAVLLRGKNSTAESKRNGGGGGGAMERSDAIAGGTEKHPALERTGSRKRALSDTNTNTTQSPLQVTLQQPNVPNTILHSNNVRPADSHRSVSATSSRSVSGSSSRAEGPITSHSSRNSSSIRHSDRESDANYAGGGRSSNGESMGQDASADPQQSSVHRLIDHFESKISQSKQAPSRQGFHTDPFHNPHTGAVTGASHDRGSLADSERTRNTGFAHSHTADSSHHHHSLSRAVAGDSDVLSGEDHGTALSHAESHEEGTHTTSFGFHPPLHDDSQVTLGMLTEDAYQHSTNDHLVDEYPPSPPSQDSWNGRNNRYVAVESDELVTVKHGEVSSESFDYDAEMASTGALEHEGMMPFMGPFGSIEPASGTTTQSFSRRGSQTASGVLTTTGTSSESWPTEHGGGGRAASVDLNPPTATPINHEGLHMVGNPRAMTSIGLPPSSKHTHAHSYTQPSRYPDPHNRNPTRRLGPGIEHKSSRSYPNSPALQQADVRGSFSVRSGHGHPQQLTPQSRSQAHSFRRPAMSHRSIYHPPSVARDAERTDAANRVRMALQTLPVFENAEANVILSGLLNYVEGIYSTSSASSTTTSRSQSFRRRPWESAGESFSIGGANPSSSRYLSSRVPRTPTRLRSHRHNARHIRSARSPRFVPPPAVPRGSSSQMSATDSQQQSPESVKTQPIRSPARHAMNLDMDKLPDLHEGKRSNTHSRGESGSSGPLGHSGVTVSTTPSSVTSSQQHNNSSSSSRRTHTSTSVTTGSVSSALGGHRENPGGSVAVSAGTHGPTRVSPADSRNSSGCPVLSAATQLSTDTGSSTEESRAANSSASRNTASTASQRSSSQRSVYTHFTFPQQTLPTTHSNDNNNNNNNNNSGGGATLCVRPPHVPTTSPVVPADAQRASSERVRTSSTSHSHGSSRSRSQQGQVDDARYHQGHVSYRSQSAVHTEADEFSTSTNTSEDRLMMRGPGRASLGQPSPGEVSAAESMEVHTHASQPIVHAGRDHTAGKRYAQSQRARKPHDGDYSASTESSIRSHRSADAANSNGDRLSTAANATKRQNSSGNLHDGAGNDSRRGLEMRREAASTDVSPSHVRSQSDTTTTTTTIGTNTSIGNTSTNNSNADVSTSITPSVAMDGSASGSNSSSGVTSPTTSTQPSQAGGSHRAQPSSRQPTATAESSGASADSHTRQQQQSSMQGAPLPGSNTSLSASSRLPPHSGTSHEQQNGEIKTDSAPLHQTATQTSSLSSAANTSMLTPQSGASAANNSSEGDGNSNQTDSSVDHPQDMCVVVDFRGMNAAGGIPEQVLRALAMNGNGAHQHVPAIPVGPAAQLSSSQPDGYQGQDSAHRSAVSTISTEYDQYFDTGSEYSMECSLEGPDATASISGSEGIEEYARGVAGISTQGDSGPVDMPEAERVNGIIEQRYGEHSVSVSGNALHGGSEGSSARSNGLDEDIQQLELMDRVCTDVLASIINASK